ncbi:hypothetical protein HMPREF0322_01014 [Desulfitobacterium hafniense DP7]|uniref:Uncharacterized protein n=1 Tax=Desulfitobacterium hafniense DP7 TaxID=537010 RepID=G9XJ88_DESHA|nr:hypothetical protein HMPREF0322_01014 [Desulfitobacterium hafniense DP7]
MTIVYNILKVQMPNYVFHNCCSPREFEEFVRDVLEVELSLDD